MGPATTACTSLGAAFVRKGLGFEAILAALREENEAKCEPPLDDAEVVKIARNAATQVDRGGPNHAEVIIMNLADITSEPVEWLWKGRIPRGMLTLFVGPPDVGKSFTSLDIAARVTTGGEWPDGGYAPKGNVIILNVEDAAATVIRPRFDTLSGDVARIKLQSLGVTIDSLTEEQEKYLNSWEMGT